MRNFDARRAGTDDAGIDDALAEATAAPRIVIARVSPGVDDGRYPAKGVAGLPVAVEADVFMDGHDRLAAQLLWRDERASGWQRAPMQPLGNDRWRALFIPQKPGRYLFSIEAWLDRWGSYRADIAKKCAAGNLSHADVEDGRQLVRAAQQARSPVAGLPELMRQLVGANDAETADLLLSETAAAVMTRADSRPFLTQVESEFVIDVERPASAFGAWYELFPRSQTRDGRHGTFDDVVARLPSLRAMGFDVLYLPPIHPVGTTHRKGRNNNPVARPDDPGSPYAIGSGEGGHEAVHPQLGGLAGFRRLVTAARDQGMEIALDFAIQCSPDHPWLKSHPEWFSWRTDGSVRHAENPPKKYEDIVNVDFYAAPSASPGGSDSSHARRDAPGAQPGLWLALRDVVLYCVGEGVKIFRVDNPHTKPLPFWQWLIRDVRSRHPEVIFLAEAFTRPAMMYQLGKIGFSQSYTYFTWRNTKQELTDYFTELTTSAPKDFYRPHLFVNTPDINPYFLQTSGRAGFLIRAALASTLSGLWGLYSGFELCEAAALPGKEEYLDSEKYEIKPRDWNAQGNIVNEISQLNRIRHENVALHSHLGLKFYNAWNDQVLYYGKAEPGRRHLVMIAVSLDPHHAQETEFEAPLWEFGLPDDGTLEVEELMTGARFVWRGKVQHWRFTPEMPFAIWRVRPEG